MKVTRRALAGLIGVAMLLVPGAAWADPPGSRTVEYAYDCSPCGVSLGPFGAVIGSGVTFWPRSREHYVRIQVADDAHDFVPFEVWQGAPNGSRFVGRGCGEAGPFLIDPRAEVTVFPLTGACTLGRHVAVTQATEGTVRATFERAAERTGGKP